MVLFLLLQREMLQNFFYDIVKILAAQYFQVYIYNLTCPTRKAVITFGRLHAFNIAINLKSSKKSTYDSSNSLKQKYLTRFENKQN